MEVSRKITNYVLGLTIIGMGAFAYFTDVIPNGKVLSILFIAYGLWRIYRGYSS